MTGSSTTTDTVTISTEILLEKSFEFLLQRESNTSILSQFKLEVISQYSPDYANQALSGSSTLKGSSFMSTIQGIGKTHYLAAHMKGQARHISIDPRKVDEKDPFM